MKFKALEERVPESEERGRNAFLIFGKERDRNATTKINTRVPFAFLFLHSKLQNTKNSKLLPKMQIIRMKYFIEIYSINLVNNSSSILLIFNIL